MIEPYNTLGETPGQNVSLRHAPKELIRNGGVAGMLLLGRDVIAAGAARVRDVSEYAVVDSSAMLQIAYIGLCSCYAFYHLSRSRPPGAVYLLKHTPALLLLVYAGLCALSSLWSSDLALTAYRSLECLCILLLIVIACNNLSMMCSSPQGVIEWLILWSIWVLCWDTLYFARIAGPGLQFFSLYLFRRGAFALSMVFFLAVFVSRRRLFAIVTVIYSLLSSANTTYFGVFFGCLGGFCVGGRRFQAALFFLAGIFALMLLGTGSTVIQHTLFQGKEGIGMEYTSGRDKIWRYSLDIGMERPWCGYGFVTGETDALWSQGSPAISTHNVFLSALLAVGIAGPMLFVAYFAWLFAVIWRANLPDYWRSPFIGTAIMILIVSVANPGIGARVYGSWIPAVLVSVGICTIAKWEHLAELNGVAYQEFGNYAGVLEG